MYKSREEYFLARTSGIIQQGDKIVICDMDGTFYRNSLFLDILERFTRFHSTTPKVKKLIEEYKQHKSAWKKRKINYDDFLYKGLDLYTEIIKTQDIPYSKIKFLSKDIAEKVNNIYSFTYEKLVELQKEGYKIIFISGSPEIIVRNVVKKFGFDSSIGTYLHVDENNNVISNLFRMALGYEKKEALDFIKKEYNPSHIISFGDTNGDTEILMESDESYAINPNYKLYDKIKGCSNVNVVIERKDLILLMDHTTRMNTSYLTLG